MKILATGLLTAIILIHSCFLKTGIFIQNLLGWVKIGLVIFMIFTSLFAVLLRPNERTVEPLPVRISREYLWEGSVWNWGIISTAFFKVFFSYAGLHNVNNVLNEVKDPVRTLKSAASAALLTACILYLLVNIAYFLVVPIDDIKESGELIAALFFERVFGAKVGRVLLPIAVSISAAGNVMVVSFSHVKLAGHSFRNHATNTHYRLELFKRLHDKAFCPSHESSPPLNPSMLLWALWSRTISLHFLLSPSLLGKSILLFSMWKDTQLNSFPSLHPLD